MGTRSDLYALFYSGDVVAKLAMAKDLYVRYGKLIALRPEIMSQLAAVQVLECAMQTQMGAMGMGATCVQCANRQGGGCCSRYMAGENDVLQLLMNLLAGVQVAVQRDDLIGCCFLGAAGCILTLKPMFCLNYNCIHITGHEDPAILLLLEQRTGELLCRQNVLESLLLDFFCERL